MNEKVAKKIAKLINIEAIVIKKNWNKFTLIGSNKNNTIEIICMKDPP